MRKDEFTVWSISETLYNTHRDISTQQAEAIEAVVQPHNHNVIVTMLNGFGITGKRAEDIATATVNHYCVNNGLKPQETHVIVQHNNGRKKPRCPWRQLRQGNCFIVPTDDIPASGAMSFYSGARQAGLRVSISKCEGGLRVTLKQPDTHYALVPINDHIQSERYPWEGLTEYNCFFVPTAALSHHADPMGSIRASATYHGKRVHIRTTPDGYEVRLKVDNIHSLASAPPLSN